MKQVMVYALMLVLTVTIDVSAQQREGVSGLLGGLNLTAEQKVELRKMKSVRQEIRQLGEDAKEQRKRLMKMLRDQSTSDEEVQAQLDKVVSAATGVMKRRVATMLKFRKILDKGQYRQFTEKLGKQMKERQAERFGR